MEIAIISEGESDQIIIEAIVQKTLENKDIVLDPLQPKPNMPGGWPLVISYCNSEEFKSAFAYNDLMIIHIDADVLKGANIPSEFNLDFNDLSVAETFDKIKTFLIAKIGAFYESQKDKIIFAIAIDQIECWFLPIYFQNKPAISGKISGCINALNKILESREGFYIDSKNAKYFSRMAKHFFEKGAVERCARENESFRFFHQQLIPFKPEATQI